MSRPTRGASDLDLVLELERRRRRKAALEATGGDLEALRRAALASGATWADLIRAGRGGPVAADLEPLARYLAATAWEPPRAGASESHMAKPEYWTAVAATLAEIAPDEWGDSAEPS